MYYTPPFSCNDPVGDEGGEGGVLVGEQKKK